MEEQIATATATATATAADDIRQPPTKATYNSIIFLHQLAEEICKFVSYMTAAGVLVLLVNLNSKQWLQTYAFIMLIVIMIFAAIIFMININNALGRLIKSNCKKITWWAIICFTLLPLLALPLVFIHIDKFKDNTQPNISIENSERKGTFTPSESHNSD